MRIKELLKKTPFELTDEEFKYIGKYYSERPGKLLYIQKPILHKCIDCKWLVWYDNLGGDLWECLKNPCNNLETQSDRLKNNRMITHKRKCKNFIEDIKINLEIKKI